MTRIISRVCVLAAVGMVAIAPVMADMSVRLADSYGDTDGGEFLATASGFSFTPARVAGTAASVFQTFCVERTEHVSFGTTYYVNVNTAAVQGGGGAVNGSDPLDPKTAYVYEQFIDGTLAGFDYGTGSARVNSANALQNVIWGLEGEWGTNWTPAAGLQTTFYNDAVQHAGTSIGNVRILNMYGDAARTQYAQDQLIMLPPSPPQPVPAPGAALLGCVGLGTIRWARRRFS